jgi:lipopolysaccharide heptosyltransferase II
VKERVPEQILVIRLGSMGDVLLATPLLRVLRRAYPASRLRFLAGPDDAELVRLHPDLDDVLVWPSDRRHHWRPAGVASRLVRGLADRIRHDGENLWVVDLQASPRSLAFTALLRPSRRFRYRKDYLRRELLVRAKIDRYPDPPPSIAERYFNAVDELGLLPNGEGLDIVLGDEAKTRAQQILSPLSQGGILALAPGARWATNRWPPEAFAAAARRLAEERGWKIVVLGGGPDTSVAGVVALMLENAGAAPLNLAGRLSLLESAAVLLNCDLLLTNASGLMHVAAALRVPAVVLFGSTVPAFGFAPYRSPARVLGIEGLPCRPCTHRGRTACPLGHFKCMREIEPDRVIESARELLAEMG